MSNDPEVPIEEQVRRRAYELWEQAGRPSGRSDEFWREAWSETEAELLHEQDRVIDNRIDPLGGIADE